LELILNVSKLTEVKKEYKLLKITIMAKKFKCLVCGYIHEGETAPEECPLCFVGPEDFKEIENDEE
jgi:rubrerythrin